jgi:hypothetical protein
MGSCSLNNKIIPIQTRSPRTNKPIVETHVSMHDRLNEESRGNLPEKDSFRVYLSCREETQFLFSCSHRHGHAPSQAVE